MSGLGWATCWTALAHPMDPRPLFFITEFTRFYGSQRSLLLLIRELLDAGIEAAAVFPGRGRCVDVYEAAGVPIHILPGPPVLSRFGKDQLRRGWRGQAWTLARDAIPYSAKVAALANRIGANVIHCNTAKATLFGSWAWRAQGKPVVTHVRGMLWPYPAVHRWVVSALSSRLIAVADAVRPSLPGWAEGRTVTIYNAVDERAVSPPGPRPADLPPAGERPVVALVGSVAPEKGQHHLVEIARRSKTWGLTPAPFFAVVGAEEHAAYSRHLRRLCAEHGVDNVAFLGWKDDPFAYYRHADVALLTSVLAEDVDTAEGVLRGRSGEGLPRAVLEPMFLGRPVVAYDIAGVREMIDDGVDGRVVPNGDAVAAADVVAELLEDGQSRQRLGDAAREKVLRRFDRGTMTRRVLQTYGELLGGRPGETAGTGAVPELNDQHGGAVR